MKLQMAKALLDMLSWNIGKKAENGYLVKKLLIVPSDNERQMEYLQLYGMNGCNDHGMIGDCYRNDGLTIIVIFQDQFPVLRYQHIKQFLLKEDETSTCNLKYIARSE